MASTTIPVPSLSPSGWITDIAAKADALMSHFFESNKSQSYIYNNNVSNLQWLIEQYGSDSIDLTTQMTSTLEKYLGRYFDLVTVTVTSDDNAKNLSGSVTIKIHCLVTQGGVQYSLGKLLQISNSTVTKIFDINNG